MEFPFHTAVSAPADSRPDIDLTQVRFGFLPNLAAGMAESPSLLRTYLATAEAFAASSLTGVQQAVVLLTVSRYHECRYCMAAHSVGADMARVPTEITDAIREDRSIPDPDLQRLREFVVHLLVHRGWADRAQLRAMAEAGFAKRQVLDVLVGVSQKTLSNYFNHMAGTRLDEAFSGRAWEPQRETADRTAVGS